MARKIKAKQAPAPAAPQGAYGEWKARARRCWNARGFRPVSGWRRAWRNAFISGETPEQAADRAEVEARNARTSN